MIEEGDKVVCISDRNPCCSFHLGDIQVPLQPVVGRYYIVSGVGWGACNKCGAELPALSTPELDAASNNAACWPQECFRKIEGSSEDVFKLASIKEPELV